MYPTLEGMRERVARRRTVSPELLMVEACSPGKLLILTELL
jgi:hypothetical protein